MYRRLAFTLIELLTVMGIIAVLASLFLAAVQHVRAAAHRMQCQNNLRQLAIAAHNFESAHGNFPVGLVAVDDPPTRFRDRTNLWVEALPFIEQSPLKGRWDYSDYRKNFQGGTAATTAVAIPVMLCPSDVLSEQVSHFQFSPPYDWYNGYWAKSSYGGNGGTLTVADNVPNPTNGVFYNGSRTRTRDLTDGMSQTFLFGERYHRDSEFDIRTAGDPALAEYGPLALWGVWASAYSDWSSSADTMLSSAVPINYLASSPPAPSGLHWIDARLNAYGSGHTGGANFAFADGSVKFVSDSIPLEQLQALSTRSGSEVVEQP